MLFNAVRDLMIVLNLLKHTNVFVLWHEKLEGLLWKIAYKLYDGHIEPYQEKRRKFKPNNSPGGNKTRCEMLRHVSIVGNQEELPKSK